MDNKTKFNSSEELLRKEIETIEDEAQKERMRFLLNEYTQPRFKINVPIYTFFITLILCGIWTILEQRQIITAQNECLKSVVLHIFYDGSEDYDDADRCWPQDSTMTETSFPAFLL